MKDKEKELSFEEALKRLEKIAEDLEREDISLDASLSRYEEGMKLMQVCHRKLDEAKKKVDVLVKRNADTFELEPFDEKNVEAE
ncbi:MAG: exodeoxyribonuclease VII small subunit [Candidatus Omnitrophica bacterium]|nr:exodeoxyribonuclease VII small subunit [Candidatus Omnitrophota bacterium]